MSDAERVTGKLTMAFASPILRLQVPGARRLNDTLVKEATALRNQSPGLKRSNLQGWHSENDLMSRPEPGLSQLSDVIRKAINTATETIAPEFEFDKYQLVVNGWININPTHGFNVPHRHNGFMWSGCYYVTVPEVEDGPSGNIEFLSPVNVAREYAPLKADCYKERLAMRPKPGEMLIFPSYLMHWVFPNEAEDERITIAFNGAYLPK